MSFAQLGYGARSRIQHSGQSRVEPVLGAYDGSFAHGIGPGINGSKLTKKTVLSPPDHHANRVQKDECSSLAHRRWQGGERDFVCESG